MISTKLYTIIALSLLRLCQQGKAGHVKKKMNYYCERCGQRYSSVATLTAGNCSRHPDGAYKGKHKLYEGTEKAKILMIEIMIEMTEKTETEKTEIIN